MATRSIALGHEFDLLHDDDEETVVGTPPHQGAIVVLDTGLNLCARRRGLPWFVGNQQPILIPRAGYGPPRRLLPDIWVHPTLTPTGRSPLLLVIDDPPALVIEVASPSTVARDADPAAPGNKVRAYEALGVAEYLVFDPVGRSARRTGAGLAYPGRRVCPVGAECRGSLGQRGARHCLPAAGAAAAHLRPGRPLGADDRRAGRPHRRTGGGTSALAGRRGGRVTPRVMARILGLSLLC